LRANEFVLNHTKSAFADYRLRCVGEIGARIWQPLVRGETALAVFRR